MTASELADLAATLRDYVERGGDAQRWLASKDLAPADRRAVVLLALSDDAEGAA